MHKNKLFKFFLAFGILFILLSFSFKTKNVQIVKINWLDSVLNNKNDTTYIINFWATWCMPCVAELPIFDKIKDSHKNKNIKVLLVSLDYYKKLALVVVPFLEKKKIKSTVVLLNEPDANDWINKVASSWSGAIPATLIVNYKSSFRAFLEKEVNFEILDSIIKTTLNKK